MRSAVPSDVVVTTYEVANMEKSALQKFHWKYIIVDHQEGPPDAGAAEQQ